MELTIEQVENGYILSYNEAGEDEINATSKHIVIEEDEIDKYGTKTTKKLLYAIMDHFGLCGSKHDEERIYIERRDQNGEDIEN